MNKKNSMPATPAVIVPAYSEKTREKIRAILDAGTAPNTRIAYRKDLEYFAAWAEACGEDPDLPVEATLLARFITDHLTGLDQEVDRDLVDWGVKSKLGPHAVSTVKRRVAALSVAHQAAGIVDNPCRRPEIRLLLSKGLKAAVKAGYRPKKKRAAVLDLVDALIATCGDDNAGLRDRALIAVGFASGGRRRSELAEMIAEDIEEAPGGYVITLPYSKTDQEGKGIPVPVIGRAAVYLEAWLLASGIRSGPVFRRIAKGGRILETGLSGNGIAKILKKRARAAGLDPKEFAGHSLRSGFMTETGRQGRALGDAMAMSGHRSTTVALDYHQAGNVILNPCARVMEKE